MAEPLNRPAVLLVLHDVAPQTWADYQPFVEAVDAMGDVPMTWLVVPDFHRRNALDAHPGFCRLLSERVARGDELALHGYFHDDQEPGPSTPRDWFMRRLYTHEGEFYQLSTRGRPRPPACRHCNVPTPRLAAARFCRPGLADERRHPSGLARIAAELHQ